MKTITAKEVSDREHSEYLAAPAAKLLEGILVKYTTALIEEMQDQLRKRDEIISQLRAELKQTKEREVIMWRDKLIANGVRNLKEFGYSDVDKDNILTDYIFTGFFRSMLEDNKGLNHDADIAIAKLLAELNSTL